MSRKGFVGVCSTPVDGYFPFLPAQVEFLLSIDDCINGFRRLLQGAVHKFGIFSFNTGGCRTLSFKAKTRW